MIGRLKSSRKSHWLRITLVGMTQLKHSRRPRSASVTHWRDRNDWCPQSPPCLRSAWVAPSSLSRNGPLWRSMSIAMSSRGQCPH